jgi:hypothetical protein
MLLDIGPPFSDLTGIAHIAVDPQPSRLTVAFAQTSFQRFCWRAPADASTPVQRSTECRGFWSVTWISTHPSHRYTGRPAERVTLHIGPASIDDIPASAPGHEIPHWLPPPPDPQPSDRIAQIPAMAARPLRHFCCYLQRNISYRSLRPGNPAAHYPAAPSQKAYHAIMATLSSQVMLVRRISPLRASLLDKPVVATY